MIGDARPVYVFNRLERSREYSTTLKLDCGLLLSFNVFAKIVTPLGVQHGVKDGPVRVILALFVGFGV